MEKLHSYQGWTGRFHEWRDSIRQKYSTWKESHPETGIELIKKVIKREDNRSINTENDYSHVYR